VGVCKKRRKKGWWGLKKRDCRGSVKNMICVIKGIFEILYFMPIPREIL
jgi:hypothetical protein